VPGWGLVLLPNAVFVLVGLGEVVGRRARRRAKIMLLWLLLAPLASSLTREAPHVLRSSVMLPMPMVLAASGASKLWQSLRSVRAKALVFGIYGVLLVVFGAGYYRAYFGPYARDYAWAWQDGYKEMVEYVKEHYGEYDKIVVTKKYGEPHEFFLFYWPWDPTAYREDPNLVRFFQSNWYWVDRFDKFYFVNDWDIAGYDGAAFALESGEKVECLTMDPEVLARVEMEGYDRCLVVAGPGGLPGKWWQELETIRFLGGEVAFGVYSQETP